MSPHPDLVISTSKPPLQIMLCAPRGFCAGVVRAIDAVEQALKLYGAPVYVRHEIVHNKYVVESLKQKGAIFVDELDEVPDGKAPVIFSAHGVPKSVPDEAKKRGLFALDATCPLVTKVHREAELHHRRGRIVVLIGHAGHPEVIGTMGQLPEGAVLLVETVADVLSLTPEHPDKLAYATQTTLSVDDTEAVIAALKSRFPEIAGPHKEDICYATTNRQESVKQIAPKVDAMIVVGSPNSSNSQRLREVAERAGYWVGGAIPWVKTTEVNYCVIDKTDEHITSEGLAQSAAKLLPAGTLLLAMYGQGVTRGRVAILGIDAACNQACAAIRAIDDCIEGRYLYHYLVSRYEAIRQLAHGGQQQNLNLDIVRDLPVVFPSDKAEQREIVAILDAIDRKIDAHQRKRAVLDDLFRSLLHKLMTGEIAVRDLDLSSLNRAAFTAEEVTI